MQKYFFIILCLSTLLITKEHPSLDPNSWFNDSADDENAVYQTLRTLQELKESQKQKNPQNEIYNIPNNQSLKKPIQDLTQTNKLNELKAAKLNHEDLEEKADDQKIKHGAIALSSGILALGVSTLYSIGDNTMPVITAGIILGIVSLYETSVSLNAYQTSLQHHFKARNLEKEIKSLENNNHHS